MTPSRERLIELWKVSSTWNLSEHLEAFAALVLADDKDGTRVGHQRYETELLDYAAAFLSMTRKELDAIALEVEGMMTTDPYDWIEYHQEYAHRFLERIKKEPIAYLDPNNPFTMHRFAKENLPAKRTSDFTIPLYTLPEIEK